MDVALRFKESGNQAYHLRKFEIATIEYSKGIEQLEEAKIANSLKDNEAKLMVRSKQNLNMQL